MSCNVASLLELGEDVAEDVEEQVGVVVPEDQSGPEADGLVPAAPQHHTCRRKGWLGLRGHHDTLSTSIQPPVPSLTLFFLYHSPKAN